MPLAHKYFNKDEICSSKTKKWYRCEEIKEGVSHSGYSYHNTILTQLKFDELQIVCCGFLQLRCIQANRMVFFLVKKVFKWYT
jgi:hypothetical protein